jgi:hypothetical protein
VYRTFFIFVCKGSIFCSELGQTLPKDFRGSLPTIEDIEKKIKERLS